MGRRGTRPLERWRVDLEAVHATWWPHDVERSLGAAARQWKEIAAS